MPELEGRADDEDSDSNGEDGDFPLTVLQQRAVKEKAKADKDSNLLDDDNENDSGTTTDDYSSDEAPAGAAPAKEPANREAQKAAKSVAKGENMALAGRVGKTNKGEPPEFDPVRFGMYYTKINADLEISNWRMANEYSYMHTESYNFFVGYERGETKENLHGQY